jgi:hypothetical protein
MPAPAPEAFADHGQVSGATITGNYDAGRSVLGQLAAAGIDFGDVTEYLEHDGLAKFEKSWSELGATAAAELERQQHPALVTRDPKPDNPRKRPSVSPSGEPGHQTCSRDL